MTAKLAHTSAGTALRVRTARGEDAAAAFDERWDALLDRQGLPAPDLCAAWLREVVRLESGLPFVALVEAGDALVAGAAFGLRRPGGRRGPQVATWLGQGRASLSATDALVDADVPAAGGLLMDCLLAEAHAVNLNPVPLEGAILPPLRSRTPWLHVLPGADGWSVPLPPPKLKALRREDAYLKRRAERDGVRIDVAVAQEPDAVAAALERLFVLHRARWEGRPEALVTFSSTEAHRAWYRRTVAAMAANGQVRIAEVFEDGELVAGSLGFVAGRSALFHTTATRLGGRLKGPGHAALLALVEAAMASGAEVMNLGRGSGEQGGPKASLGPQRLPLGRLVATRSRVAQRALTVAIASRTAWRRARGRTVEY